MEATGGTGHGSPDGRRRRGRASWAAETVERVGVVHGRSGSVRPVERPVSLARGAGELEGEADGFGI
jgi:hypothetical protein